MCGGLRRGSEEESVIRMLKFAIMKHRGVTVGGMNFVTGILQQTFFLDDILRQLSHGTFNLDCTTI